MFPPVNAAHLLWNDTRMYRRRHEKAAAALVATARTLAKHRPLAGGEREFLSLYARTKRLDPYTFTAVWCDPTAYFWVRMAYQLTATCLTGSALPPLARDYCADVGAERPEDALAVHLDAYKRFVLAAALVEGGGSPPVRFERPLEATLPLSFPGTGLSLVGSGTVRIHALVRRCVALEHEGRSATVEMVPGGTRADGIQAIRCPALPIGDDVEIHLDPHALNLPGLGFAREAARQPLEFQARHQPFVAQVLRLVKRHQPRTHRHFADMMRLLVMKPLKTGDYTNLTHSDLPGAAICSLIDDPYEMADTFIHELHHNRLFFVEEKTGPFFRDATAAVLAQEFYSPWRNDLRPLHGLFHALYVYLPVARFWVKVHRSGEVDGARRAYVLDRVLRIPLQLQAAAAVLRRHADLTKAGAALFEAMERDVRAVAKSAAGLDLPSDAPALKLEADGTLVPEREPSGRPLGVREAVTAHIAKYDVHAQCGEFGRVRLDGRNGGGVDGYRRAPRTRTTGRSRS
jgi:HEXXH motif-containing protein